MVHIPLMPIPRPIVYRCEKMCCVVSCGQIDLDVDVVYGYNSQQYWNPVEVGGKKKKGRKHLSCKLLRGMRSPLTLNLFFFPI